MHLSKEIQPVNSEFFADIGLDLQNDDDLKFIADINKIQTKNALDQGFQAILLKITVHCQLKTVYIQLQTLNYSYQADDPDFLLSKEENPLKPFKWLKNPSLTLRQNLFVTEPYYGLSLKGATERKCPSTS